MISCIPARLAGTVDLLDIRILRALGLRPFAGPARAPSDLRPRVLARGVGLSRETVRKRLDGLREDGVLQGFHLVPNYRLLGVATTTYHVVAPRTRPKGEIVGSWRANRRVTSVFDFLGSDLCIEVAHPPGAAPEDGECVIDEDRHPAPVGAPTPLAWRLLKSLRRDAMQPLDTVAAEIGCSARTARRLARGLAHDQHADVVALLDPSAMEGLVSSLLRIDADPGAAPGIVRACGDHRMSSWQAPGGTLWVTVFAPTPAGIGALGETLRGLPGVRNVEALIPGRVDADASWIDERLPAS